MNRAYVQLVVDLADGWVTAAAVSVDVKILDYPFLMRRQIFETVDLNSIESVVFL